jgi:hypothetical protein
MNLNLGCGEHIASEWLNVDAVVRTEGVNLRADVLNLPFRPGSVSRIYAGHLVEHMTPSESERALAHWLYLLVDGGELGVVVPDIQRMWPLYVAGGFTIEDMTGAIGGKRDPADPYALHLTVWTQDQIGDYVARVTGREVRPLNLEDWPAVSLVDWQVGVVVSK